MLNGDNSEWTGTLTTGNGTTSDNDRNHIVRFGNTKAIAGVNALAMSANSSVQVYGNDITVGNLTETGDAAATGTIFIENANFTSEGSITVKQTSAQTVDAIFRDGVAMHKDCDQIDQRLNVTLDATTSAIKLTLTQNNSYTGKTTVNQGILEISTVNGGINDSIWLDMRTNGTFANNTGSTYTYDGTISGTGKITGNVVVGDNVGSVNRVGIIRAGASSSATDLTKAGNQIGTLTFANNLTLAASQSPATPVVRAEFQLGGATGNINAVTGSYSSLAALVAAVPTMTSGSLVTGTPGNHDQIKITGALTLNADGQIKVSLADLNGDSTPDFNPSFGDVYNLMDWTGLLTNNGFDAGTNLRSGGLGGGDLDLPDIAAANLQWDVSLFLNYGTLVVVPEPSRMLLLMLALGTFILRRRC